MKQCDTVQTFWLSILALKLTLQGVHCTTHTPQSFQTQIQSRKDYLINYQVNYHQFRWYLFRWQCLLGVAVYAGSWLSWVVCCSKQWALWQWRGKRQRCTRQLLWSSSCWNYPRSYSYQLNDCNCRHLVNNIKTLFNRMLHYFPYYCSVYYIR